MQCSDDDAVGRAYAFTVGRDAPSACLGAFSGSQINSPDQTEFRHRDAFGFVCFQSAFSLNQNSANQFKCSASGHGKEFVLEIEK